MAALTSTPDPAPEAAAPAPAVSEAKASAPPPAASDDAGTAARMAALRRLVRQDGLTLDAAAREIGVDPIIAQLWLRLPDDLLPAGRAAAAGTTVAPPPLAMPAHGLRRVLTCRIPAPAYDRLRAGEAPITEAAVMALETGLALPRPETAAGGWRFARRPLAVAVPGQDYAGVMALAHDAFNDDPRDAAGWLIARGLGMSLPLPTADELAGAPVPVQVSLPERLPAAAPRFVLPPRRRPEVRAPLPADDSAPSGDELRQRREALGISQRDLAAASGLSRGLVAEVERGRRRHVLTRMRLAETLASLERSRPAVAAAQTAQ